MSTPDEARTVDLDARRVFSAGWYSARRHTGIAAATHSPDYPGASGLAAGTPDEAREELARSIAPMIRGWLEEAGHSEDVIRALASDISAELHEAGYRKLGPVTDAETRRALSAWYRGIFAGGWTASEEERMRAALEASRSVLGNPQHETPNQEIRRQQS